MYTVTYRLYGRYDKRRQFDTHEAAKGFFYGYCVRNKNVGSAELKLPVVAQ